MQGIHEYYNQLAPKYDQDRFGNSYGKFIDLQEKGYVNQLLQNSNPKETLDLACGTGRFLPYAHYGVDLSEEMIKVAQEKYPQKKLFTQSATQTNFADEQFSQILSFHLIMHLDLKTTSEIFQEAARILRPGGRLIFDIPSKKRRQFVNYKAEGWHGANALDLAQLEEMTSSFWTLQQYRGVLFLHIHRIPNGLRSWVQPIDNFLCRSPWREYASYLIVVLEKK